LYSSHCSCFAHLLDLHSFPTRRSSDLNHSPILFGERRARRQESNSQRTKEAGPVIARLARGQGPFGKSGRIPRPRKIQTLAGSLDRKSTRLNSSHSQISYAVFCLKKKT